MAKNRELMGATDPQQATGYPGALILPTQSRRNAVHGSDSLENAAIEIAYFFAQSELCD